MSVNIKRVDDRTIHVNDKPVQMDSNGNWIATVEELNNAETKAFYQHLNSEKLNMYNRLN